jgi:hypothetical protein
MEFSVSTSVPSWYLPWDVLCTRQSATLTGSVSVLIRSLCLSLSLPLSKFRTPMHVTELVILRQYFFIAPTVFPATKLDGLSPRANYTDRATAACRRSRMPNFAYRGWHVASVTVPYCRILGYLDRRRYFFFQVAPQIYSGGWVDPMPDSLLLRKPSSARNWNRNSGSVARNSNH